MVHLRKMCLFVIASTIYTSSCLATTPLSPQYQTGWDSIKTSTLRADIKYLASDQLKGRLTLDQGDELATNWIVNQFKQAGLKPGNGDSYLQAIKLIEYKPDLKHSYLSINKQKKWKSPDVFTEYKNNIDITSNVVFAGYGITATDLNYDDYKGIDVNGKIVAVFEHEPQEVKANSIFNGLANTIYATNRVKALNAQQHGAVAILIMPEPNRKHPSNQERRHLVGGATKRKTPIALFVSADDELHIPILILSDTVAKNIVGNNMSLSKTQTAIDITLIPQSRDLPNTRVTIHDENTSHKAVVTQNVVGVLEGTDDKLSGETIIVSAHHDHDGMFNKKVCYGADDNASGTVGVIALSHALVKNTLSSSGIKPKRSILFVVFGGEERGLLGSLYMTYHPLRKLDTTRAMINFDMIGRNETKSAQTNKIIEIPADTSNRLNLIGSHYSPDYQKTIIEQDKFVGLTLDNRFDEESALNVLFRSDQFPFMLHGIPAFWWFTGFHPDYHQVTDTADKINYTKMQKIIRLAYLSTYAMANADKSPAFIKNPATN